MPSGTKSIINKAYWKIPSKVVTSKAGVTFVREEGGHADDLKIEGLENFQKIVRARWCKEAKGW